MTDHLPQFVIAVRYSGQPWPDDGPMGAAIASAQLRYEAGEIELAQRKEGRLDYQYAIPRKRRGIQRPGYFPRRPAVSADYPA